MGRLTEIKSEPISDELWQPEVIYKKEFKVGPFKKETIPYPFICNNVFRDEKEAAAFMPFFINKLIKDKDIPEDVIMKDEDGKLVVNEDILKPCFMKLHMSVMEQANNDVELDTKL
jgi:hypothetical protein